MGDLPRRGLERIVLGTVQLGLPYGRLRGGELMPEAAAHAILDAAWELGIRAFDTAEAYGDSPRRLAEWVAAGGRGGEAHVVTKVKPGEPEIARRAADALARFPEVARLAILTHGFCAGLEWQEVVGAAGPAGAAAGQSVYGQGEVETASALAEVARVQAPGNLFDAGAFVGRGGRAVALDLRSVYLQGVLLEAPEAAERRAPGAGVLARAVAEAAADAGEDPAVLLVAAMLRRLRDGDRLVLGVDEPEQLGVISRAVEVPTEVADAFAADALRRAPADIASETLDPRRWP